ncbi:ROK family transcriptional regulator [Promicromonospora iranensis]|uniref:NBD/HSP70 family sugar kinase n=1 Tax=Promicromonospora iranensis TaxID=1105144 RepID=A0ABU2CR77_9MICO|nr:ROK family transcriptional regulator [Promicromonospora iranensis]MDR7383846.1 putative NBD/HSP70 family sugar kinase [Promicromonospora iranensis]
MTTAGTARETTTRTGPGAARQHTLRERNLELVARAVYEVPEPLSRAGVAAATGLARATVSTLVDQLVAAGLVRELPAVTGGRAGRPAVPLVPAPRSVVGLGLEVNVDYLGARVLDLTGEVVSEQVVPGALHDSDPTVVLGRLGALAREVSDGVAASGMTVAGARLALPGLVDPRTGLLEVAPNLGWSSLDPVPLLGLGDLGVRIANEAKLAALAELAGGSDVAAPDSFIFVSGDVGIGAAIVVDRALFLGERGWNGEIGHVVVDPAGPRCSCGAFGCLEQYAGKEAMMRAAGLPLDSALSALITRLTEAGDAGRPADGRRTLPAGRALGSALADFVNLLDVSTIVLGGAYTELLPWLRADVEEVLADRVLSAPFVDLDVRAAQAGPHAALTGGAREVLQAVLADPAAWV